MKVGTVVKSALIVLIAAGAVCAVKPALIQDYLPESVAQLINKSTKVRKNSALPADVKDAVKQGDYGKVQQLIVKHLKGKTLIPSDPVVLDLTMLHEIIRTTGADIMTAFAAADKQQADFLADFATDPEWQELYLGCGLVPWQTDVGLDVLNRIWQSEKGRVKNKPLATALASAWGGGETDPEPMKATRDPERHNPVWRYHFFQKNARKGLLHPNFPNLRPWELRFVVGTPWQDWDDLSYEWALEHINVPWDRYPDACWAATYTDPSKFGDSVQSGMYNLPYSDISMAQTTHLNGGVCGAMSHLGCVTAQAHGIPAYTVGQPGHCAYAVRVERGKWVGGFGGPDGGMHNRIFGNEAPTSYLLMETVFADDATIGQAYRLSYCARAYEALGDTASAIATWNKVLELSPLHPFFRSALHKQLKLQGLTPERAFDYLSATIPLYEGNGFSAVNMAADLQEQIDAMNDEQKSVIFSHMHKMIATTPSSWAVKCEKLIQKQSDALKAPETKENFLAVVFATHMNAKDATTFGQVLEWAVGNYIAKGQEEIFGRAFSRAAAAASTLGGEEANEEKLKKLREAYAKAIFAAETSRSVPAFRSLTEAAVSTCGKCPVNRPLDNPAAVSGTPTAAAMLRLSSTCQWDSPAWHINITTPTGGQCHTNKEERPEIISQLPEHRWVTGCIIRKRSGNENRMTKAIISTSEDGATWVTRATTDNMPREWAVNFPDGTRAKWLKITFDNSGQADFAHISHFVTYCK